MIRYHAQLPMILLSLLLATLGQPLAGAPLKVGILGDTASGDEIAVLEALLSEGDSVIVTKRADLSLLVTERKIALAGLRQKLDGRLLEVDALILVEKIRLADQFVISTRLVSVKSAAVIDHLVAPLGERLQPWATGVRAALLRQDEGLSSTAGKPLIVLRTLRPPVIIGVSETREMRGREKALAFTDQLGLALMRQSGFLVAEQERLAEIAFDLGLVAIEETGLPPTAVEVLGEANLEDDEATVRVGVRHSAQTDTQWLKEAQFSKEEMMTAGVDEVVQILLDHFRAEELEPRQIRTREDDAIALHEEAKWLYQIGRFSAAERRWESSRALGQERLESDLLGVVLGLAAYWTEYRRWNFGPILDFSPYNCDAEKRFGSANTPEFPTLEELDGLVRATARLVTLLQKRPDELSKAEVRRLLDLVLDRSSTPLLLYLFKHYNRIPTHLETSLQELRRLLSELPKAAGTKWRWRPSLGDSTPYTQIALWREDGDADVDAFASTLEESYEDFAESVLASRMSNPQLFEYFAAKRKNLYEVTLNPVFERLHFFDWITGEHTLSQLASRLEKKWADNLTPRRRLDIQLLRTFDPANRPEMPRRLLEYVKMLEAHRGTLAEEKLLTAYLAIIFYYRVDREGSPELRNEEFFLRMLALQQWATTNLEYPSETLRKCVQVHRYPKAGPRWREAFDEAVKNRSDYVPPTSRSLEDANEQPSVETASTEKPKIALAHAFHFTERGGKEDSSGYRYMIDYELVDVLGNQVLMRQRYKKQILKRYSEVFSSYRVVDLGGSSVPAAGEPYVVAQRSFSEMPDWMWDVFHCQGNSAAFLRESGDVVFPFGPYLAIREVEEEAWSVDERVLPWSFASKSESKRRLVSAHPRAPYFAGIVQSKTERSILRVDSRNLKGSVLSSTKRSSPQHWLDRQAPGEVLNAMACDNGDVIAVIGETDANGKDAWKVVRLQGDGQKVTDLGLHLQGRIIGFQIGSRGWGVVTLLDDQIAPTYLAFNSQTAEPRLLVSPENKPVKIEDQVQTPQFQSPPPAKFAKATFPTILRPRPIQVDLRYFRSDMADYDGETLVGADPRTITSSQGREFTEFARPLWLWKTAGTKPKVFALECPNLRKTNIKVDKPGMTSYDLLREFRTLEAVPGPWGFEALTLAPSGIVLSTKYEACLLPWGQLGNSPAPKLATPYSEVAEPAEADQTGSEAEDVGKARRGAAKNDPSALCDLGFLFQSGKQGLPMNHLKALELYHRAAALGNPMATNNLGQLYQLAGRGLVYMNPHKAIPWLEKAAALDVPYAHATLAQTYWYGGHFPPHRGIRSVHRDHNKAERHARAAYELGQSEEIGSVEGSGAFILSRVLLDQPGKEREALGFAEISLKFDTYNDACVHAATAYLKGEIIDKDLDRALAVITPAAARDYPPAVQLLAEIEAARKAR